jgi:phosphoribosyl 1,2-cyclic phosphodiesterase
MSLFVASLNSGSNGNCYYVGNNDEAILIDGGISCRETEKRLKRLGLSIRKVKAIFVTHEHGDHVHGIPTLSRKHKLPVYITAKTLEQGRIAVGKEYVFHFGAYSPVRVGSLEVTAFPKLHDATDPHSFVVRGDHVQVGIFTDIGRACEHVTKHFRECHAAFLESNYDEGMLESGRYPYSLKNRIRNGQGHLSNVQAAELFQEHKPPFMTHLFLSHLSKDNNRPKIAQELFKKIAGRTEIILAPRNKETRLYHIRNQVRQKSFPSNIPVTQLGLFA